ncbi:MAG: dTMP kinase [Gammaproteobacteria bacterium]|jgi:dTMP kinase
MTMTRAKFITLEGSEGVGKSTQCALLASAIVEELGQALCTTREPGGTALGESIRSMLLDTSLPPMDAMTEVLLMFAARAEHLDKVIQPALNARQWVLCDRFTDASYAYQGGGRGLGADAIAVLENLVQNELRPDLTIILDLDVEVAFSRIEARTQADRFELEKREFFKIVRQTYLERAERFPDRIVIVDAAASVQQVHLEVLDTVRKRLL